MTSAGRIAVPLLVSTALGCAPSADDSATMGDGSEVAGPVLISAAASLTDAFRDMAEAFEAAHPASDVALNFAGSTMLEAQIQEGAPVDVFAAADTAHLIRLLEAGEVEGSPRVFARNRMLVVVPRGNPAGVRGLADFGRDELVLGLCAPTVPCGALARRVLQEAGVAAPAIDTAEPDVRALLTKVELGELDAAVAYVTDVEAAGGRIEGIDVAEASGLLTDYTIAVLTRAPHPRTARSFTAFVLSEQGRSILTSHGFVAP